MHRATDIFARFKRQTGQAYWSTGRLNGCEVVLNCSFRKLTKLHVTWSSTICKRIGTADTTSMRLNTTWFSIAVRYAIPDAILEQSGRLPVAATALAPHEVTQGNRAEPSTWILGQPPKNDFAVEAIVFAEELPAYSGKNPENGTQKGRASFVVLVSKWTSHARSEQSGEDSFTSH